jgi:hypothetical protein
LLGLATAELIFEALEFTALIFAMFAFTVVKADLFAEVKKVFSK